MAPGALNRALQFGGRDVRPPFDGLADGLRRLTKAPFPTADRPMLTAYKENKP